MDQNRRDFLKVISIASASILPVIVHLKSALGLKNNRAFLNLEDKFNTDLEFHILDNNLINLRFYFINVKKKLGYLSPSDPGSASYMIIRMPQMHLSESGFWNPADVHAPLAGKPTSTLSGYSFLAFKLWPDVLIKTDKTSKYLWGDDMPQFSYKPNNKKTFRFSLDVLLDWNNKTNFDLITLIEWFKYSGAKKYEFDFVNYSANAADVLDFEKKKVYNDKIYQAAANQQNRYEPKSSVFLKYRNMIIHLLANKARINGNFVPASFMEMPQGMALLPFYRNSDGKLDSSTGKEIVAKLFWENRIYYHSEPPLGIKKYEIWNNQLFFQRQQLQNSGSKDQKTFAIETPSFRAAGLITNDKIPSPALGTEDCLAYCKTQQTKNVLPSLLDKAELAYLTQFASDATHPFTDQEFDIRELNGLFFTGLGIITHLKYDNLEKCPDGIDLIEYEHIVTQGRDIFIRVARLGYNVKTGQRYKHVIEGKRKIELQKLIDDPGADQPVSFIELKQYCECIDKHINYGEETGIKDWNQQFMPIKNTSSYLKEMHLPVISNPVDQKRLMYKDLQVIEKERIPIDCLQDSVVPADVCALQCLGWFWPVKESAKNFTGPTGSLTGILDTSNLLNYLLCEYEATDWEGKKVTAATPFMFIRKSFVENVPDESAYINYFKGDAAKEDGPDPRAERRKTYFQNQKIAFSPSLPKEFEETDDPVKNKVNILETEFIESYFNIKNLPQLRSLPVPILTNQVKYAIYPQILRARVYLDHVRDLTQQKIPSVFQYHEDYIKYGFSNYILNPGGVLGNGARLIMRNTDAFVKGNVEEPVNRTYTTIKGALQSAKSRLGTAVTIDIDPFNLSLRKTGITDPVNPSAVISQGKATIDSLGKIAQMSPAAFLGNTEILGIKVVDILHTFVPAIADTPLFNLNKLMNEVEGSVLNSPVYKAIGDFKIKDPIDNQVATPSVLIAKYNKKISKFNLDLETARKQLNEQIRQLSDLIPDGDSIDNLVKALYEHYRTKAFDLILENIDIEQVIATVVKAQADAAEFLGKEQRILTEEYEDRLKQSKDLISGLKTNLPALPPELQKIIVNGTEAQLDAYIEGALTTLFNDALANTIIDDLYRTISETVTLMNGTAPVYYVAAPETTPLTLTFELTGDPAKGKPFRVFGAEINTCGYLQLQIRTAALENFISKNFNGTKFQRDCTTAIQPLLKSYHDNMRFAEDKVNVLQKKIGGFVTNIAAWKKKAEEYIAANPAATAQVKNAIYVFQGILLQTQPYADFIRKYDPYYYYTEQQRLKQQITDVRRRFFGSLISLYGEIDANGDIINCGTYDTSRFESILCEIQHGLTEYKKVTDKFVTCLGQPGSDIFACRRIFKEEIKATGKSLLNDIAKKALNELTTTQEYRAANAIYKRIDDCKGNILGLENDLKNYGQHYKELLQQQADQLLQSLDQKVTNYINEQTLALLDTIDPQTLKDIQQNIEEARNIYRLITSIKNQHLTYTWETQAFKDVDLGIVAFKKYSNPDTSLKVNVNATTYFSAGKFPPAIEKATTYAENRVTNFGITFFNSLTIGFNEVNFITGSESGTRFDVKIKDVKFDGALSFVQAFESWFQTLGTGFVMRLEAGCVVLSYSLPIPSIQTPAFSFFNLSLNFDLRIFFDSRPLLLGFSLATPESKFGISAFIYAGFGYFGIAVDPKNGVVMLDISLEAGAWAGISIGPIRGEVKLAFGFRYTKTPNNVHLEGYIVAEGRLSVWILEVYARIYLGIVSDNSSVDGECRVTYSVKLGFISKSFSGTFHKHIAGAETNNTADRQNAIKMHDYEYFKHFHLAKNASIPLANPFTTKFEEFRDAINLSELEAEDMDTYHVSDDDFRDFINNY